MPPAPVHRSTTRTGPGAPPAAAAQVAPWAARIAASATISVSGRGTNTPARTSRVRYRKPVSPVRCWRGSRAARRSRSCQYRASRAPGNSRVRSSSERPRPHTWAARSSASTRAAGTPACSRYAAAALSTCRIAWPVLLLAGVGKAFRFVQFDRGPHHRVEVPVEHVVEVVGLVAGAVIGDPVLGEVVGADALGAVNGTHLGAPRLRLLRLEFLLLRRAQARTQNPHRCLDRKSDASAKSENVV